MSNETNFQIDLPSGFHYEKPSPDGPVKIWLTGDQFFKDLWDFFITFEHIFSDPKLKICCLKRGAGAHVTVIGNGARRRDIYTMQVGSYDENMEQGEVIFAEPLPPGLGLSKDGEGWVFVDDLSDTGTTISAIRVRWPKAKILTVYAKPQGEKFPDGFYMKIPDIWVVFPGETPWDRFIPNN